MSSPEYRTNHNMKIANSPLKIWQSSDIWEWE
jgi:hypothetical protein